MATSKRITELDAITSAANTDVLYIVHDPAGVPASNKITIDDVLKNVVFTATAPSTSTSTGKKGQIIYAAGHLYICVATNSWVRTAVATSW
jgi:hypothetical protein